MSRCDSLNSMRIPAGVSLSALDEMLMASIEGGHLEAMQRLLDAGARIDGDPDSEEIPLGHACWRGRVHMTRELLHRGAAVEFRIKAHVQLFVNRPHHIAADNVLCHAVKRSTGRRCSRSHSKKRKLVQ